jgi:hypothetical protein
MKDEMEIMSKQGIITWYTLVLQNELGRTEENLTTRHAWLYSLSDLFTLVERALVPTTIKD